MIKKMNTATQNLTLASARSFTLTRIFKKMAPFPEDFHRPRAVLSIDVGRSRWVADFQFDGADHLFSFSGDDKRARLAARLADIRRRHGLEGAEDVVACYEIGRDGFWIRDFLESLGVPCVVLTADVLCDGGRTPKTDSLDARRLAQRLRRFCEGEPSPRHVCVPPDECTAKARLAVRRRLRLVEARTSVANCFKSILATRTEVPRALAMSRVDVDSLKDFRGAPLSAEVADALKECLERWKSLDERIRALEKTMEKEGAEARAAVESGGSAAGLLRHVGMLLRIQGIGSRLAWILGCELFFRSFRNGGQVGSATGLVDVPFASGSCARSRGISRRSNARLRGALLELAWLWLRLQPESAEARWFAARTAGAGGRQRKICAVGMARRIAVALWRHLRDGSLPEGWKLKADGAKSSQSAGSPRKAGRERKA